MPLRQQETYATVWEALNGAQVLGEGETSEQRGDDDDEESLHCGGEASLAMLIQRSVSDEA